MLAFVIDVTSTVVFSIIQILVGCIFSIPIYRYVSTKPKRTAVGFRRDIPGIFLSSFCGMILPLGTYGVIPIVAALLAAEFDACLVLPLIFSNALFNLLVPFADPGFIWRTGIRRVVLALFIGVLIGFIARKCIGITGNLFRDKNMPTFEGKAANLSAVFQILSKSMNILGIYLLVGVLLNTVFHRYILWSIIDLFYINTSTAAIPRFFSTMNVTNPFFLLSMTLVNRMIDFTQGSALLALLKPKGLFLYFCYYSAWTLLLASSAFL